MDMSEHPDGPPTADPGGEHPREPGTAIDADATGQLRLVPSDARPGREWELDERARRIGRAGVAAARAALQRARPPAETIGGRRAS